MTIPAPLGTVAHYTLLERLEPAGPGELFRARDTHLGRTVTVRMLPASFGGSSEERTSLVRRVRSISALSHPNITALFDVGEHDGRMYVVFEFLKGGSLRAEMAGRMMSVRRAVELAIQIADAVAAAHAAGFIHGGLSPESIGVTAKGSVKVPAFELATRGGFEQAGSQSLRDYKSPEEVRGERGDERSDIYSIGAILYEMLTTRQPHHRGASGPSASNRDVPPDLDEIALKAVAPNPAARFQSTATFAGELRRIVSDLHTHGGDEGDDAVPRTANVGQAIAMAAIILLALATLVWLVLT